MSTHDPFIHPDDARLLDRLGHIAELVDPAPPHLAELGKQLFAFRDLDAQLMRTVDEVGELLAVRGERQSRLHFFELGAVTVDVEVTSQDGFCQVLGSIAGADDASGVSLETAGASFDAVLDDGRFTFDRVPVGLVRLRLDTPTPLTTRWFDAP